MKYTFEKKLNIVSRVKAGCPIRQLAKENNLHENKILDWVRLYDRYGVDILRKRSKIKPTSDFKEQVVREILEKGLPLSHALIKYRISVQHLKAGFVRFVNMDIRNYIYLDVKADLLKLWQDLRKKNLRQNWKSFRRKTCA